MPKKLISANHRDSHAGTPRLCNVTYSAETGYSDRSVGVRRGETAGRHRLGENRLTLCTWQSSAGKPLNLFIVTVCILYSRLCDIFHKQRSCLNLSTESLLLSTLSSMKREDCSELMVVPSGGRPIRTISTERAKLSGCTFYCSNKVAYCSNKVANRLTVQFQPITLGVGKEPPTFLNNRQTRINTANRICAPAFESDRNFGLPLRGDSRS